MAVIEVPFGPQHPVLPEPIQLKLKCEGEKVVEAIPNIGYIHRGIEKAGEIKDFKQNIHMVERICGICSFQHAMCYCQAIEDLIGAEVPDRARYLRVIWAELNRIRSHTLWLGCMADSYGFESLFMQCWRNRDIIVDAIEKTTGQRIILSTCVIGGVRRDIDDEMAKDVEKMVLDYRGKMDKLYATIKNNRAIRARTRGIGLLKKELAIALGAVGPVARGSGVAEDMRTLGGAAYKELGYKPVVEEAGDCWARTMVRLREVYTSIDLILKALSEMPEGKIYAPLEKWPEGETFQRVEQPRGQVTYYIKGNGTRYLERLKIRTPTFANIPPLLAMLSGCELANAPVITLSIDPCIACTERMLKIEKVDKK